MTDSVEVLVIGAGVVGLAVARRLALRGSEVIVVEQHRQPGQETSSRNSGVIHSGIYYPTGSLKARLCVIGRDLMYAYCSERGIKHRRCGKIIVAQESQRAALTALHRKAVANGVHDLTMLTGAEVRELEPQVQCAEALLCPSTGIVDVHEFMTSLVGDIESYGGSMALGSRFASARVVADGLLVRIESGGATSEIQCRWLINSAGLHAVPLLTRIEGYPVELRRNSFYAKGNYFVCQGARPFKHLVYPMPNVAGLGIHATLDLDGSTRFGPDVEWVSAPDYSLDPKRAEGFYKPIREYWPYLKDEALQPAYAGIRPKLVGPEMTAADFLIETPELHGVAGLINLLGIESPGLTSSLAIAENVLGHI